MWGCVIIGNEIHKAGLVSEMQKERKRKKNKEEGRGVRNRQKRNERK